MKSTCYLIAVIGTSFLFGHGVVTSASPVDFAKDVQPLLKRHCDRCHGDSNQEGALALNRQEGLLGTADSGESIVVPGKPDQSLLMRRVTDPDSGDLMPLDGTPLDRREVEVLRRWISQGAKIPDHSFSNGADKRKHWAYVAPSRDALPASPGREDSRSPIDQLIQQKVVDSGLVPAVRAKPSILARRVSLALTGLPASIKQVKSLSNDPSAENYERLVDELLADDSFGIHWARHWLDLARYADSNGFQADQLRDSWAYRDWVVDALNADMPFDQFVVDQLAGDLIPDADQQSRIATGFHRTPTCNVEAGVDPEANRVNQVFDRVNTTATVFLGTTLECAQCHDHKYDPFTQREYYQLFAYFNNTPIEVSKTSGVTFDFVGPTMDLDLAAEQQLERNRLSRQIRQLRDKRERLTSDEEFAAWRRKTAELLRTGQAEWITPAAEFSTTGGEEYELLEDHSVLLRGPLPKNTRYEFGFKGISETICGVRVDALRHDELPGGGPGRGDVNRTNFVLNEVSVAVDSAGSSRSVRLGRSEASFSQSRYDVSGAVDGDLKTAWAVAPKFKQEHWAQFELVEPLQLADGERLSIGLQQNYGQGRVIGRPKVSLLIGTPETAWLPDSIVALLSKNKALDSRQILRLEEFFSKQDPQIKLIDDQIDDLTAKLEKIKPLTTLVMVEQSEARQTHVMNRGDYLAKGEEVEPSTPRVLHPLSPDLPKNRLGLAKWIVDPSNPLLSRVTVNRFWNELFGRGIVATPEDFGTQSESPTHPELLDYLALRFQEQGWSIKSLLKEIVLSETFQQSSDVSDDSLRVDPENRFLSRGPRFRMPAEMIRDNALAVSALLCEDQMGPPIMPFQPGNIWRAVGRNQPKWVPETDRNRFRRGLYVVWKRGAPYPSFVSFDAPDRASCTVKRPRTNTPLQALVLMNDLVYSEAAIGLAARMLRYAQEQGWEPGTNPDAVARFGFEVATARAASDKATDTLVQLYLDEQSRLTHMPTRIESRLKTLPDSLRESIGGLDEAELAAWYAVASAILNLDVTITLN